jgi:hypothetical protein
MLQMHVIQGILDFAFRAVDGYGSPTQQLTLGFIVALRRIYAATKTACETLVLAVRETLRDLIVAHGLERPRKMRIAQAPALLREPGCTVTTRLPIQRPTIN